MRTTQSLLRCEVHEELGARALRWRPHVEYTAIRFVRFPKERLEKGVEFHMIEGVRVPIFGVTKTPPMFFAVPDALTPEFGRDASKRRQWDAFVRQLVVGPDSLETVVSDLAVFLMPMAVKARASTRN